MKKIIKGIHRAIRFVLRSIHWRLEEIYLEIRWAFQRVFRGFDDRAYWSLDTYVAKIIIPVCEWYQREGMSFDEELGEEGTRQMYADMAEGFRAALRIIDLEFEPGQLEAEEALAEKGLALFHKHFYKLWD